MRTRILTPREYDELLEYIVDSKRYTNNASLQNLMHRIQENMEDVLQDTKICLMALQIRKSSKVVANLNEKVKIIDIEGLNNSLKDIGMESSR